DHPRCDGDNYDPYRAKNLASNLIAFLDQKNLDKVVWIGHDWGAILVWKIGMYYPERCLANISVGIPYSQPTFEYVPAQVLAQHFPQFRYFCLFQTKEPDTWFEGDPKKFATAMFNSVYGSGIGTSVQEKQFYIDSFSQTTLHGAINYYRAVPFNHEDELPFVGKPYTVPSLQIIIEKDPVVTPALMSLYKTDTAVNLEKVSISEGGHNVHTENPEGLNKVLDDYLAKVFDKKN
ncbi:hypothetical protein BGZ54_004542, partial [Gamsiella multidivaricata]